MIPYAKHIHVLHLLSTIPPVVPRIPGEPFVPRMTPQQAAAAWDHMFTYIHANWAIPKSYANGMLCDVPVEARVEAMAAVKDCGSLLSMPAVEFVAKLSSLPPFFSEYCFPIAVARFMLRESGIDLNHRATTTFTEFHNRYGYIILADCY